MTKEDEETLITKASLLGYELHQFDSGWAVYTPTGTYLCFLQRDQSNWWYWEHPYEAALAALKDAGMTP